MEKLTISAKEVIEKIFNPNIIQKIKSFLKEKVNILITEAHFYQLLASNNLTDEEKDLTNSILHPEIIHYTLEDFLIATDNVKDITEYLSQEELHHSDLFPSKFGFNIIWPPHFERAVESLLKTQNRLLAEVQSYAGIYITDKGNIIFDSIINIEAEKIISFNIKKLDISINKIISIFLELLNREKLTDSQKELIAKKLAQSKLFDFFTNDFLFRLQQEYILPKKEIFSHQEKYLALLSILNYSWQGYSTLQSCGLFKSFREQARLILTQKGLIPVIIHTHPRNKSSYQNRNPSYSELNSSFKPNKK